MPRPIAPRPMTPTVMPFASLFIVSSRNLNDYA
jgi:hypothetical protein